MRTWLSVECALTHAYETLGKVPKGTSKKVEDSSKKVTLKRVNEIEDQIHHDVMSMVKALSEQCGDAGNYIHLGATSYDIVDTSWGLIFKDVLPVLEKNLKELMNSLLQKAEKYNDLVCIGRTHGQHAIPTTLGYKFALYALDISRHLQRLHEISPRLLVGKMSGAVGNYASFSEQGDKVEKEVMKTLGLAPIPSTQVVPRDAHAEYLFLLSLIGQSLTRLSLEIRNLQRTEIGELEEPFGSKQVGSSTMPQKETPTSASACVGLLGYSRLRFLSALTISLLSTSET